VLTDALSKLVMLFEFEDVVVVDDDFILAFLELNVDLVTIVCIYVYVYNIYICRQILIYLSIAI
jgi:hypothetical protein